MPEQVIRARIAFVGACRLLCLKNLTDSLPTEVFHTLFCALYTLSRSILLKGPNLATLLLVVIYIAFISLGLPDALLGAAWPVIQAELQVPYSVAGAVSMTAVAGTVLASIFASRIARRFGTARVTAVSVALTAIGLFGFALSPAFPWLLLAAIPLGFGAGAIDSGLNAFVAEHYESRHMSWLHSFWGVGALTGPLLLSALIAGGESWRNTYFGIGGFQTVLFVVLLASIPLWKKVQSHRPEHHDPEAKQPGLFAPLKLPGVWKALLTFFSYCAVEATMGLWGGSFLFKARGMDPAEAAGWVSAFFAAITAGRFLTGFLTSKVSNNNLILGGILVVAAGVLTMLLPLPTAATLAGFVLVGLGCAPIFPCMLHETPIRFGRFNSQAVMGFQMATAYVGVVSMPPLFGLIGDAAGLGVMPYFLLLFVAIMLVASQSLRRVRAGD